MQKIDFLEIFWKLPGLDKNINFSDTWISDLDTGGEAGEKICILKLATLLPDLFKIIGLFNDKNIFRTFIPLHQNPAATKPYKLKVVSMGPSLSFTK